MVKKSKTVLFKSKTVLLRTDPSFKEVIDSYKKAIELSEGHRLSTPQASGRMAKKLMQDKKWW